MLALVGNFLLIIGTIAILSMLLSKSSTTVGLVNSLSQLLTNSITAAKT